MSDRPFFSVIMPTYNRAGHIGLAIESVLFQTFKNFELLIVDDGSTDDTRKVIDKFSDQRLKYFYKKNEERNIARNFGIARASGKYIAFLDSDDRYLHNHLELSYQLIQTCDKPVWLYIGSLPKAITGSEYLLRKHLINENYFSINGVVIIRSFFSDISFIASQSAIVGEDHYLWLRLAARYPVGFMNTKTSIFTEHNDRSLSNINLEKLIIGTDEIIANLKADTHFIGFYNRKSSYFFAHKHAFVALIANEKKEFLLASKALKKAIAESWKIMFNRRFLAAIKNLVKGYFFNR